MKTWISPPAGSEKLYGKAYLLRQRYPRSVAVCNVDGWWKYTVAFLFIFLEICDHIGTFQGGILQPGLKQTSKYAEPRTHWTSLYIMHGYVSPQCTIGSKWVHWTHLYNVDRILTDCQILGFCLLASSTLVLRCFLWHFISLQYSQLLTNMITSLLVRDNFNALTNHYSGWPSLQGAEPLDVSWRIDWVLTQMQLSY